MLMDVTAPTMSLPTAAMLAGLRPGYVRALLNEGRIVMLGQPVRRPGQAHRAAIMDLIRLVTLRRLRDAGLNDGQAIHVIDLALDGRLGGLSHVGFPIPWCVLASRLQGGAVQVVPSDGDAMPDVRSVPEGYAAPFGCAVVITLTWSAILADVSASLPTAVTTAISGNHT